MDLWPCRYSYTEETGDDLDEEGISLTGSAVKVGGDLTTKLERKERKGSIGSDHVLGLGVDIEEDKREWYLTFPTTPAFPFLLLLPLFWLNHRRLPTHKRVFTLGSAFSLKMLKRQILWSRSSRSAVFQWGWELVSWGVVAVDMK